MGDILTFGGNQVKTEALDESTIRFTLPVKVAIFDQLVSNVEIMPEHQYRPSVTAGTFGGTMDSSSKPSDIIGTGPLMLGTYKRGESITLKKNPNYWKKDKAGNKLPYIDELVTQIVGTTDAMVLNFERGNTDFL